jgi:hypothetical protein
LGPLGGRSRAPVWRARGPAGAGVGRPRSGARARSLVRGRCGAGGRVGGHVHNRCAQLARRELAGSWGRLKGLRDVWSWAGQVVVPVHLRV